MIVAVIWLEMIRKSSILKRAPFAIAMIIACAATVLYFSNRANPVARDLYARIQRSNLPELDKNLTGSLVQTPEAWKTGLIEEIVGIRWRQIVWDGTATLNEKPIRIFIMDSYVRPVSLAPAPMPPLCIVTDDKLNLLHWDTVADYSVGFLSASMSDDETITLTITGLANWYRGAGTYKYIVTGSDITQIGETDFHGIDDGIELRPFLDDPPALREALIPFRNGSGRYSVPSDPL